MPSDRLKSVNVELTHDDVRYILHALNELTVRLEAEVDKDPDGDKDITPMYAEDVLILRSLYKRLRERAVPVFGENQLKVSYETL